MAAQKRIAYFISFNCHGYFYKNTSMFLLVEVTL